MAKTVLRDFLEGLHGLGRSTESEVLAEVKKIKIPGARTIEEIIKDLPVRKDASGIMRIAERTLGEFDEIIKSGNLARLLEISGKKFVKLDIEEIKEFGRLIDFSPRRGLQEIADETAKAYRRAPDLFIKASDLKDLKSLSESTTRKITKVERNIFKYLKKGGKLLLITGAVAAGTSFLINATKKKRGCFLSRRDNGKTTHCKVSRLTCIDGEYGNCCESGADEILVDGLFNTTLVLMTLAKLEDNKNPFKIKIAEVLKPHGISIEQIDENLVKIIDNYFADVDKVIHDELSDPSRKQSFPINVCGLTDERIDKEIPVCRLCVPSADPKSTKFIDPVRYASNITFQCNVDPTLLETIVESSIQLEHDILGGIGSGIWALIKPFAIGGGIILALILAIVIIFKFVRNPSDSSHESHDEHGSPDEHVYSEPFKDNNSYETMEVVE